MKYNCENCIHYGKGGVLNRRKKCANCQVDIKNHEVVGKPSNYEERREVFSHERCSKCGKIIATIYKVDNNEEYQYIEESTSDAFIDKWGYRRKFCKECMK